MDSPRRVKKSLGIAKNTILEYKKKIKNLQQSRRVLKTRITSLKNLTQYLKTKFAMSETAESSISVSKILYLSKISRK